MSDAHRDRLADSPDEHPDDDSAYFRAQKNGLLGNRRVMRSNRRTWNPGPFVQTGSHYHFAGSTLRRRSPAELTSRLIECGVR